MNDTNAELDKAIDKIRKLMAMSTSANEAEAAAFLNKAQEELARHNLSMSDIASKDDNPEEEFTVDDETRTDSRPWRRSMASLVGEMYFCRYFYTFHKKPANRACGYIRYDIHSFVGAKHNIAVAKMMFQYLNDTIDRLAKDGAAKMPIKERTPFTTAFRAACANRLCWRIRARIDQAKAGTAKTSTGTNLPALANLYEKSAQQADAYLKSIGTAVTVSKSRAKPTHRGGMLAGDNAGRGISLDGQVGVDKKGDALPGLQVMQCVKGKVSACHYKYVRHDKETDLHEFHEEGSPNTEWFAFRPHGVAGWHLRIGDKSYEFVRSNAKQLTA